MASIPLPALGIKPPEDQTQNQLAMISALRQGQLMPGQLQEQAERIKGQQLANEQARYNFQAQQALNKSYQNAVKPDANGIPQIDPKAISDSLSLSGFGSQIPGAVQHINDFNKSYVDLHKDQTDLQTKVNDLVGSAAAAVKAANYDPKLAHTLLDSFPHDPQTDQLRSTIDSNPQAFRQMIDTAIANSPKQRELAAQEQAAQSRGGIDMAVYNSLIKSGMSPQDAYTQVRNQAQQAKQPPLAQQQIDNLNKIFSDRYQVLNPGQQLPSQYTLQAGATQKDADTIDKGLEQVEKATGAKAAKDQAAATAAAAAADRADKAGMKPIIGFDKNGNQVFASASDAKQMGLKGVREVGQSEAEKVTNARNLVPLLDNNSPEEPGVLQMAKKLESEGKLGPLASRWNDFLTGKWGAGDPEYAAFRAKMGLSTTALMQVHVGSRGGAFMLEHFEDLANAKKMDGSTLISSLDTEAKYVKRKAMLPNQTAYTPAQNSSPQNSTQSKGGNVAPEGTIVQTPKGRMIKKNGQWVAY